jgi:transposase
MRIFAMDLGKFKSVGCLLDRSTAEVEYHTVPMEPERVRDLLGRLRPDVVAFEICTDAGWVADICRELSLAFRALNPSTLVHAMHRRRSKTDRKDAFDLAQTVALSVDLQKKCVHVPERPVREHRALIEQRSQAVAKRTSRQNEIRAMFQQYGYTLPGKQKAWSSIGIASMRELAATRLPSLAHRQIEIALRGLAQEEREIAELEQLLDELASKDSRVKLLQTVPGVGPRLSETVVAWIDDPERFGNAKQAGCYTGLTSRPNQSGMMNRSSRISKAGPSRLRSMLVEVSWIMLRWNDWAREVYERVRRGSASRKKQAIVALARRLFVRLWAMLRDGRPWDPGHSKSVAASFAAGKAVQA